MTRVLVATGNPGKLAEFRAILEPHGYSVVSPVEVGWDARVEEDGDTLEANAEKKARAGVRASEMPTLADDSGLFVEALDGAPGIHSARYAGEEQNAEANCAKLLAALEGVPRARRGAAFRCVVVWVTPAGRCRVFSGECTGHIADAPRGEGGFGYDPVFEVERTGLTFAQMDSENKNRISHRGKALARLRASLDDADGRRHS